MSCLTRGAVHSICHGSNKGLMISEGCEWSTFNMWRNYLMPRYNGRSFLSKVAYFHSAVVSFLLKKASGCQEPSRNWSREPPTAKSEASTLIASLHPLVGCSRRLQKQGVELLNNVVGQWGRQERLTRLRQYQWGNICLSYVPRQTPCFFRLDDDCQPRWRLAAGWGFFRAPDEVGHVTSCCRRCHHICVLSPQTWHGKNSMCLSYLTTEVLVCPFFLPRLQRCQRLRTGLQGYHLQLWQDQWCW